MHWTMGTGGCTSGDRHYIIVLRYSSNDCTIAKMEDWDVDSGKMIAKVHINDKTHQNTPFSQVQSLIALMILSKVVKSLGTFNA